jgi:hypothetical protein
MEEEVIELERGHGSTISRKRSAIVRTNRDSLPLPAGMFEMESDRTSALQPDKLQLGRQTTTNTGGYARLHPGNDHGDRTYGQSIPR